MGDNVTIGAVCIMVVNSCFVVSVVEKVHLVHKLIAICFMVVGSLVNAGNKKV